MGGEKENGKWERKWEVSLTRMRNEKENGRCGRRRRFRVNKTRLIHTCINQTQLKLNDSNKHKPNSCSEYQACLCNWPLPMFIAQDVVTVLTMGSKQATQISSFSVLTNTGWEFLIWNSKIRLSLNAETMRHQILQSDEQVPRRTAFVWGGAASSTILLLNQWLPISLLNLIYFLYFMASVLVCHQHLSR